MSNLSKFLSALRGWLAPDGDGSQLTGLTSAQVTDSVESWTSSTDDGKLLKFGELGTVGVNVLNAEYINANTSLTATILSLSDGVNASGAILAPSSGTGSFYYTAPLGTGTLALTSQGDGSIKSADIADATTGGNGSDDAGKVAKFNAGGGLPLSEATTTSLNGILKADGTNVTTATAGTDYLSPTGDGSGLIDLVSSQITDASFGGNVGDDFGKLLKFGESGDITATWLTVTGGTTLSSGGLFFAGSGGNSGILACPASGEFINALPSITGKTLAVTDSSDGSISSITGNAGTATALETAQNIFGISFNGTANVSGNATNAGHFASIPVGGEAGHFITLNGTNPTVVAGRSAWWSDSSGNPSFRNGTGAAGTLLLSGGAAGTPSSINLTNGTSLPISGLTASTTTAIGVGSIELGHASDTTISRVSAGRIAVEGVNVVTVSSTDTLTNKTLTTPTIAAINGGTAANDDITIQGTTNATRTSSYVFLQPNGGITYIGAGTPLADSNLQVQISTAGTGTEANYAINKAGNYCLLYGVKNSAGLGSLTNWSGGYLRMVTTDPFAIVTNNTSVTGMWLADGSIGLGGNITNSSTLAGANLILSTTGALTLIGNQIRIATSQTPASASATGTVGTICWDANYIYVCTATNTWKRTAISTW